MRIVLSGNQIKVVIKWSIYSVELINCLRGWSCTAMLWATRDQPLTQFKCSTKYDTGQKAVVTISETYCNLIMNVLIDPGGTTPYARARERHSLSETMSKPYKNAMRFGECEKIWCNCRGCRQLSALLPVSWSGSFKNKRAMALYTCGDKGNEK